VKKTNIQRGKRLDFQNFASLVIELYTPDSQLYRQILLNEKCKFY